MTSIVIQMIQGHLRATELDFRLLRVKGLNKSQPSQVGDEASVGAEQRFQLHLLPMWRREIVRKGQNSKGHGVWRTTLL